MHSLYHVDPDLSHVVLAVTKVDMWMPANNDALFPATPRGGLALQERLRQWAIACGGQEPAFLVTFRFNEEDAAGKSWDQHRHAVLEQVAAKQLKWTDTKRVRLRAHGFGCRGGEPVVGVLTRARSSTRGVVLVVVLASEMGHRPTEAR